MEMNKNWHRNSSWQRSSSLFTSIHLCHLGNVKSYSIFSLPISQPVTTETRFGPVLHNRHYSSVASLRPVSLPHPYSLILITSSPSVSSTLLFLSASLFQLSFICSLTPSVSLAFIPIDLCLTLLFVEEALVWAPILIVRERDTLTHLLLTHPCMLILAFWVFSENPQRLSEGASFSSCLVLCSCRIGTTRVSHFKTRAVWQNAATFCH